MNTSINIKCKDLPKLLSIIGEAIGKGKDLEIHESAHLKSRYVYTKIDGENLNVLGMEGEENIKVSVNPEDINFSEDEIKEMETYKICKETEDIVDQYYCNHLCSSRKECLWL